MRRKFYTLDVFTARALAGNPLAVVLDCEGLDDARMQAIAREFNLSETVFVFDPADPVNSARLRIFTPARELPFAGHPTVGTTMLLAELRAPEMLVRHDLAVVLEEKVGIVNCTARHRPGRSAEASFVVPQLPRAGEGMAGEGMASNEAIAEVLGIPAADIGFGGHRPSLYSAGVEFAFVPVRNRAVLAAARPSTPNWDATFGARGAYVYTADAELADSAFRARMFGARLGVYEDPATGSAAAAFAGVLAHFDRLAEGDHTFRIEQGFEMGRPSLIILGIDMTGGALTSASIGGNAIILQEGTINV